jgi:hypothetical protein
LLGRRSARREAARLELLAHQTALYLLVMVQQWRGAPWPP